MQMIDNTTLIALDSFIADHKLFIRDKVLISDLSLAELLETHVKLLRRKVNANLSRFPEDFMILLSAEESNQFQGIKYAFTELGVFMLSGLIKSNRAAKISIAMVELLVDGMPGLAFSLLGKTKE
jgi:hypothetical protein